MHLTSSHELGLNSLFKSVFCMSRLVHTALTDLVLFEAENDNDNWVDRNLCELHARSSPILFLKIDNTMSKHTC